MFASSCLAGVWIKLLSCFGGWPLIGFHFRLETFAYFFKRFCPYLVNLWKIGNFLKKKIIASWSVSLCHCVQYHLHPCHPDINAFGRLSFQSLVSFVPNVCPCIAAQPDQASQRKSVPQCPPHTALIRKNSFLNVG